MKKIYIIPSMKVREIENDNLLAASNGLEGANDEKATGSQLSKENFLGNSGSSAKSTNIWDSDE